MLYASRSTIDNWQIVRASTKIMRELYNLRTSSPPIIRLYCAALQLCESKDLHREIPKAQTNPSNPFLAIETMILSIFRSFNCTFNLFLWMFLLNGHKHQIKQAKNDSEKKTLKESVELMRPTNANETRRRYVQECLEESDDRFSIPIVLERP